jgi:hypothetical protein
MHRLEDAVVFRTGTDFFHERLSGALLPKAIVKEFCRVREPPPEVIVDVDHRNLRLPGTSLQPFQARSDSKSIPQEPSTIWELEMIDHVDQ